MLEKENEEGLSGRDLALARFRNRIRFGAEGTIVGLDLVYLVGTCKDYNCRCKIWINETCRLCT